MALRRSRGDFDSKIILSQTAKSDLQWWLDNLSISHSPISRGQPDIVIETDASTRGWGCYCKDMNVRTGGPWEGSETDNHINVLELQAAYFALKSLCTNKTGIHIRLMMDSMTAVYYIREQGGSKSLACNAIARKIWLWAFERQIWLSSEHLVGSLNVTADYESRHFQMETEWMLDKSVFKNVVLKSGFEPNIDLFASRVNCQITKFVSWKPQPEAYAVNVFSLDWHFKPYCFPTFSIIPRVVQKISPDKSYSIGCNSKLANPTVLCNSDEHVSKQSHLRKKEQETVTNAKQTRGNPQNLEQIGPTCMSVVRRSIAHQGLSGRTSDIFLAGWRRNTTKQYNVYLRKWEIYCCKWEINPLCASVNNVLKFLTELFDSYLGYSGINTAKSALSSVVTLSDSDSSIGKHQLINDS